MKQFPQFKSIKIELIGLDINRIIKVTYNEDERVLFYTFDEYNKTQWSGDVFDYNRLIEKIKIDLEHKYVNSNK
jgi:hypothetical protein